MNQSASFYSIATTDFETIRQSEDKEIDIAPYVKAYCTLDDSYMALEFTLVVNQSEEATMLIEEIFNPSASFGGSDFGNIDIDNIDPEVFEAMVMDDSSVYYLAPGTVNQALAVLHTISEAAILNNYDAAALNENDIFPGKWHSDNNPELPYNAIHLQKTFAELETFLTTAADNNQYVFTYLQG